MIDMCCYTHPLGNFDEPHWHNLTIQNGWNMPLTSLTQSPLFQYNVQTLNMSLVYDGCMLLSHILIKTTKLITNNNYEKNYVFYLAKPPHLKEKKKKHFPLDIPLTFSWCVGHVLLIQLFDWAQNLSKQIFYPLFQSNSQILNLVMTQDGCVSLDSGVVEYFRVFFL